MDPIYVTGHQNPDTDSIVAAIAYASLRNSLGDREYEAACLGRVSDETQIVLNHFGFQPPKMITNVYTQVKDLDYDMPPILSAAVTEDRAWNILREQKGIAAVPVVNEDGTLFGMLSREDVAGATAANNHDLHNIFPHLPTRSAQLLYLKISLTRHDGLCDHLNGSWQNYPLRISHNVLLQALGSVFLTDRNRFLQNDLTSVGYLVYEMHSSARNLNAVGKRRLMHAKSVKSLSAKGRNKRGMNVDDAIGIFSYNLLGEDTHKARKHDHINIEFLKSRNNIFLKAVGIILSRYNAHGNASHISADESISLLRA